MTEHFIVLVGVIFLLMSVIGLIQAVIVGCYLLYKAVIRYGFTKRY